MNDYTALLTAALRAYARAKLVNLLAQTEETRKAETEARDRLSWLIAAEKFGWDPETAGDTVHGT